MNCARSAPLDRGHFLLEKCVLSSTNAIFSPLRGPESALRAVRYAGRATRARACYAPPRGGGRPYLWSDPTYETQTTWVVYKVQSDRPFRSSITDHASAYIQYSPCLRLNPQPWLGDPKRMGGYRVRAFHHGKKQQQNPGSLGTDMTKQELAVEILEIEAGE